MSARITTIALGFMRRQWRDPLGIFFMLLLPILLAFLFGFADQRANESLPVGLLRADGQLASELEEQIDERPELRVRHFDTAADLEEATRRGDVYAGIVLDDEYDEVIASGGPAAVNVLGDADSSAYIAARAAVALLVDRENQALNAARALDIPVVEARERLGDVELEVERITAEETERATGFGAATAGMLVYFVFEASMFGCHALLVDRRRGVIARMATTSASNAEIISGEFLGRFALCALQIAFVILTGRLLFDVSWGDPISVAAITLTYATVSTGIGVAVGCRRSTDLSNIGRAGFVAVMGLLGGCFFALSLVPDWLRALGHVTPHAWAVDGLTRLVSTSAGIGAILIPLAVLVVAAIGAVAIVVARFPRAFRA